MYQLIFYDDDSIQLEIMKEKVKEFFQEQERAVPEFILCSDEEHLWFELKRQSQGEIIVFMDIYMEGREQNGIQLAKRINEKYSTIMIVFLTGYLHYASDVYETKHCYFILKDELKQRLPILFDQIMPSYTSRKNEYFDLHNRSHVQRIAQQDILYLERNLRITTIYMGDGTAFEIPDKLKDILPKLNEKVFVRCHNSFIINLEYVSEINRKEVRLTDGTMINVSRTYMKEVLRRFAEWGSRGNW